MTGCQYLSALKIKRKYLHYVIQTYILVMILIILYSLVQLQKTQLCTVEHFPIFIYHQVKVPKLVFKPQFQFYSGQV